MKSLKILHKDQLKLKDARIADLNSTIKSLKTKITTLEKSEAKLQSNFCGLPTPIVNKYGQTRTQEGIVPHQGTEKERPDEREENGKDS